MYFQLEIGSLLTRLLGFMRNRPQNTSLDVGSNKVFSSVNGSSDAGTAIFDPDAMVIPARIVLFDEF